MFWYRSTVGNVSNIGICSQRILVHTLRCLTLCIGFFPWALRKGLWSFTVVRTSLRWDLGFVLTFQRNHRFNLYQQSKISRDKPGLQSSVSRKLSFVHSSPLWTMFYQRYGKNRFRSATRTISSSNWRCQKMTTLSLWESIQCTSHLNKKRMWKPLSEVFRNVLNWLSTTANDEGKKTQTIFVLFTTSVARFQAKLEMKRRANGNGLLVESPIFLEMIKFGLKRKVGRLRTLNLLMKIMISSF